MTKREFVTYTGLYHNERVSVIGTGMGACNIDIVLQEIDALFNIDLETRCPRPQHTSLEFIRLGTAGSIHANIDTTELIISSGAIGFDNVISFYKDPDFTADHPLIQQFQEAFDPSHTIRAYYHSLADTTLVSRYAPLGHVGWTLTWPSFYGAQDREMRIPIQQFPPMSHLASLEINQQPILNFEMETAPLFALSKLLGHRACSISTIVANRAKHSFCENADAAIDHMIATALKATTDQETDKVSG